MRIAATMSKLDGNTDPFDALCANIRRYVALSAAEEDRLRAIGTLKRVRRRQYIDQPGYVSAYRNYIVKGAFRSFYVDPEGREHTLQIAIEDWFISDFHSYITQSPATLYVEALEDALIIQLKHADIEGLCREVHALSEYFRVTTERAFSFSRMRALSTISKSAEERYLEFTGRYPGIVQRVPQKILASYLGMTPEFLSKIRKRLAEDS